MRKRWPILLLLTVATAYLLVREVVSRGDFLGGFAIGVLIVVLVVEWFEYLGSRKS